MAQYILLRVVILLLISDLIWTSKNITRVIQCNFALKNEFQAIIYHWLKYFNVVMKLIMKIIISYYQILI